MMRAYDYDLRRVVMKAVDERKSFKEISEQYGIDRKTIYRWRMSRKNRGDFKAKEEYVRGPAPKIKDLEALKAFVINNKNKTLKELANLWFEPISGESIRRALKKINFTYKKNFWLSRKIGKTEKYF
jgi:transposase